MLSFVYNSVFPASATHDAISNRANMAHNYEVLVMSKSTPKPQPVPVAYSVNAVANAIKGIPPFMVAGGTGGLTDPQTIVEALNSNPKPAWASEFTTRLGLEPEPVAVTATGSATATGYPRGKGGLHQCNTYAEVVLAYVAVHYGVAPLVIGGVALDGSSFTKEVPLLVAFINSPFGDVAEGNHPRGNSVTADGVRQLVGDVHRLHARLAITCGAVIDRAALSALRDRAQVAIDAWQAAAWTSATRK